MALNLNILRRRKLTEVFTPGGQPSITYVSRDHLKIEPSLRKALALPATIVSITGPTKSGKTVVCKSVLLDKSQFIWIDGGQIKKEDDIWSKSCSELALANEITESETLAGQGALGASTEIGGGVPGVAQAKIGFTAGGSAIKTTQVSKKFLPNTMDQVIRYATENDIYLVIDDFHYMDSETQSSFVQSIKGPVFRGLKVVLLSTPHRAFEAIKAEPEITGRFKHVTVPTWSGEDLKQIAETGFKAMKITPSKGDVEAFTAEAEGSPLLMQRFCWNLCFDAGIEESCLSNRTVSPINRQILFDEVAEDAGLPIYERLAKGPQSRTDRIRRPLSSGGDADIYEAILLAVAKTGPKERLSYDQIRSSLNSVLLDKIPQRIEVSNALNHLSLIALDNKKSQRAIDWDADNLNLFITDPFFRFYLRWKIAGGNTTN